jgi:hypothetical protein
MGQAQGDVQEGRESQKTQSGPEDHKDHDGAIHKALYKEDDTQNSKQR